MKKNQMSKYRLSILLISISICLFGIWFFYNKISQDRIIDLSVREYIIQSYIQELPSLNRQLPKRINDTTVITSVNYEGNSVVVNYNLSPQVEGNDSPNLNYKLLKDQTSFDICSDESKFHLLDLDINISHRYFDQGGQKTWELVVSKDTCQELRGKKS